MVRKRIVQSKHTSLKKRLYMLVIVCLIPLIVMIVYLMNSLNRFSERYDVIVENITMANAYNIGFKDDLDYLMYVIVVNSERAEDLIDTEKPYKMISDARRAFKNLRIQADTESARIQLERIGKSINILEGHVQEIMLEAKNSGAYDKNLERLELNIYVMTELLQEEIQEYIFYEATNLEALREEIRDDVQSALLMTSVVLGGIVIIALMVSKLIVSGITQPIQRLCAATRQAASGDFEVQIMENQTDELTELNVSFNQMVEKIGNLVEDVREQELNMHKTELRLLQAQIHPHFLYNTLDAIIWLAESERKEDVVRMVSSLSAFFRTTLSKGRDYITIEEEMEHIRSYLEIQHFRYSDILEYEIKIPREMYSYFILKLTLQPLVENALYHGLKQKRGLGHIRISGKKEEDRLIFSVWDDGVGMTKEQLERVHRLIRGDVDAPVDHKSGGDTGSTGFGLYNVAQRLRLNYGKEYGLEAESSYKEWTEFRAIIPIVKK